MLEESLSEELQQIYARAREIPFTEQIATPSIRHMNQSEVEQVLPHRDPMLFINRVSIYDKKHQLLVAHYNLINAQKIADCYHPGRSIFPPGFQIEAMGQAGGLYLLLEKNLDWKTSGSAFTHIVHTRFMEPIRVDGSEIEMQARVFEEGLFDVIIGQCIWKNKICSNVILKGISQS